MVNNTFYIINEDGIRVDARILSKFKFNNQEYITYTYDEINEEGMIKIYVSGILYDGGIYSYKEIVSDEEWNDVKNVLKGLAKSVDEPFPKGLSSNLKYIGEEVNVRKPKKLLVSKKFADVLATKYSEEEEKVELPKIEEEPVFNIPVLEETKGEEPELEKTIKIPTFEELQARNKNIQAVMETAKEEKQAPFAPVEEVVEEKPKTISNAPYESRVKKSDYEAKFKKDVEPLLYDVFAKQQKQIEELEEELSKTKFDLFEKQKEALSLSNENEEMHKRSQALEEQLNGVQKKMDGILSVLQDSSKN